jgi:acid phosphatase (class A)
MPKPVLAAALLAVLGLGAAPAPKPAGYLTVQTAPDTLKILPEAPVAGTSRYEADRTIFLQTRSMKDGPRWTMAQGDVDQGAILKDMACALGVQLTPQNAPRLTALLKRILPDVVRAVNRPKEFYGRKRPFLIDEGPICSPLTPQLAASPDYPSGHATWGWTVGLILAELAPDRATEILVRARAFGESRIVCGVHNLSAVEAGRTNASALVAALHGDPGFRADLEAARREVAAARRGGPAPDMAACAAEAKLTAASPY